MATEQDLIDATNAAQMHVLNVITQIDGNNRAQSETIRNLAEAYAWLVRPDQPHGGASGGS